MLTFQLTNKTAHGETYTAYRDEATVFNGQAHIDGQLCHIVLADYGCMLLDAQSVTFEELEEIVAFIKSKTEVQT